MNPNCWYIVGNSASAYRGIVCLFIHSSGDQDWGWFKGKTDEKRGFWTYTERVRSATQEEVDRAL